MPTECSADLFGFAPVEGREVVAGFDGGSITSDAGGLLLGATDRAIGLVRRLAGCFHDDRRQDLIEHEVATLVGQRVFGIALGYEDINDHDELHDAMMSVLATKPSLNCETSPGSSLCIITRFVASSSNAQASDVIAPASNDPTTWRVLDGFKSKNIQDTPSASELSSKHKEVILAEQLSLIRSPDALKSLMKDGLGELIALTALTDRALDL